MGEKQECLNCSYFCPTDFTQGFCLNHEEFHEEYEGEFCEEYEEL